MTLVKFLAAACDRASASWSAAVLCRFQIGVENPHHPHLTARNSRCIGWRVVLVSGSVQNTLAGTIIGIHGMRKKQTQARGESALTKTKSSRANATRKRDAKVSATTATPSPAMPGTAGASTVSTTSAIEAS